MRAQGASIRIRTVGAAIYVLLTAAALIALVADLGVHVAAHLHLVPVSRARIGILFVALLPLWLIAMVTLMGDPAPALFRWWEWRERRAWWLSQLRGAAAWVAWADLFVTFYFFANIAALFVTAGRDTPEQSEVWFFTGFALSFFWAAFALMFTQLCRLTSAEEAE